MAVSFVREIKKVQPHGPYHFIAYCYNTAIGMEVVRLLDETADKANLIVADTMASYLSLFAASRTKVRTAAFFERFKKKPVYTLKRLIKSKLVYPLKEKYKTFASSGSQKLIRILHENHIKIYEKYDWKPIRSDIRLLLTEKPGTDFNGKVINSWNKMTTKDVVIVPVEGHHDKLFEDLKMVRKTAIAVDSCMTEFETSQEKG